MDDKLFFYSIGDWGSKGLQQDLIASIMFKFSLIYKPSFVISLGDNFYENGVLTPSDTKWRDNFENVYRPLQCVWFPVLGNHDYLGNPNAQIAYKSAMWEMPAKYYNKLFDIPNSGKILEIVFLDTVEMCPYESSKFIPINGEFDERYTMCDFLSKSYAQKLWLRNVLKNSKADFLIVVGHYPIYSSSMHGDTEEMKELVTLFEENKVNAYMCGHDHNMQHFIKNGVSYFVNGSGSKSCYVIPSFEYSFQRAIGGFMIHEISPKEMTFRFVDLKGNINYTISLLPRK